MAIWKYTQDTLDKDPLVPQKVTKEIVDVLGSNDVNVVYRNIPEGHHTLHLEYPKQFDNWCVDFIDNWNKARIKNVWSYHFRMGEKFIKL